jgi:hypothetical protein
MCVYEENDVQSKQNNSKIPRKLFYVTHTSLVGTHNFDFYKFAKLTLMIRTGHISRMKKGIDLKISGQKADIVY